MPTLADQIAPKPQEPSGLGGWLASIGDEMAGAFARYGRRSGAQRDASLALMSQAADPNTDPLTGAGMKALGLAGLLTHPLAFFPTGDEWRERLSNAGNTGRMGQAIGGMLGDLPSIVDPHLLAGGGALAAAPIVGKLGRGISDLAGDVTDAELTALRSRLGAEAAQSGGAPSPVSREQALQGLVGGDKMQSMKYVMLDNRDQVTGPAFDTLEEAQAYAATQPFTKWGHKVISRAEDLGDKYALRESWMLAGKDHPHHLKDRPDEWQRSNSGGTRRRRKPEDHQK